MSDDRIPTICLILPNELLCISKESHGNPRNFHIPNAYYLPFGEKMPWKNNNYNNKVNN